jgi:uncharacterized protein (DUF302 family)
MTDLAWEVQLEGADFEESVDRVVEALKDQGFGVLTRIDVKSTLKEKLDVGFRDYLILGACNPRLAHRALTGRPDVGILLPCNVTVEAEDGMVVVRIADPESMMSVGGLGEDPQVEAVAREAHGLLARVAESLQTG